MKIVVEPIFEADFQPCSYGFRPKRSAHEAGEMIRQKANQGYDWVVDADIENYFDTIDQVKLMEMVERRISDRRMLKLIRKFLRAGILDGRHTSGGHSEPFVGQHLSELPGQGVGRKVSPDRSPGALCR